MDKREVLSEFVYNRPATLGAYGYGSGVFKQKGYDEVEKPQLDMVLLVENLKEWHLANMSLNKNDYSLMGRIFLNGNSLEKIKGNNKITYFSHIQENGHLFKYGVMEEKDFISQLNDWENFFIAGRFHKPVLQIVGTEGEQKAIDNNRRQALLVTALISPPRVTKKDFYQILCNLSYTGTLRMHVAENPNKVLNIVDGNYEILNLLYDFSVDYIDLLGDDKIHINYLKALNHIKELPLFLLQYLYNNDCDFGNVFSIRKGIISFLNEHNKMEEIYQSLNGIQVNGLVRSTPYLLAKVKKRVKGK